MNDVILLGRRNGVGLERDAELVEAPLSDAGFSIRRPQLRSLTALLPGGPVADAAFHFERVARFWHRRARVHFLIPNQERFPRRQIGRLRGIDHILCKSHHAVEVFSGLHSSVHYLGFTSTDRSLAGGDPDYGRFFHLAGRSTLKNTGLLVDLWRNHPEWPELTLVQHPDNAPESVPANVTLVSRHLPDTPLRELQNRCGIHLCPSLSEGWGHYIAEAMSCRAVTVTTDAPPMNELVTADRGVPVPWRDSEPRHLGRNFFADPAGLESAIERLIAMPESEKRVIGEAGRHWFQENDRAFRQRLGEFAETLIRGRGSRADAETNRPPEG